MSEQSPILFEIQTVLGFSIRTTEAYWEIITTVKHPVMADKLEDIKETIRAPDEIRQSRSDQNVFLFYHSYQNRWLCAVARRLNGQGSLITAYPTDAIKEDNQIWSK